MRTGRATRLASKAAWMAIIEGYSSLPPKPPPVSAWMTTARPLSMASARLRALCT